MPLGTVVLEHGIFPIERVFLADGKYQVEFTVPRGVAIDLETPQDYRIHDQDGVLVVIARTGGLGVKPKRETWRVRFSMAIDNKRSSGWTEAHMANGVR